MKTIRLSKNLIGLGSMLALAISLGSSAIAGPGPQFWNRASLVTTTKEAEALKPTDTAVMVTEPTRGSFTSRVTSSATTR